MPLSITNHISQIVAAQPRKPGPIHDALQAIQSWASAGLTTSDLAANAGILASQTELGAYTAPTTFADPTWAATGNMTFTSVNTAGPQLTKIGKLVFFTVIGVGTIGGTPGTAGVRLTLPVTAQAAATSTLLSAACVPDGTGNWQPAVAYFPDTTHCDVFVSAGGSFTVGVSRMVWVSGCYISAV
jgi:hypothetical protein